MPRLCLERLQITEKTNISGGHAFETGKKW